MRNRRLALLIGAALLLIAGVRHPSMDLRVITHDAADLSPHKVQAAVELGIASVSVLITWTSKKFA
ncbi:hypothetical protein [Sphingomonas immobilis]|uniref:Uncharacterized protein n=1 Tax=Sphingomonas immobilis TaxID=3063997 RepID=A0ABT8ZZB0_9SPHN|nr:hypothetical protein [Sphingomonas sp. CA1-15]MDO7842537.1 hypothetical protein [Sphingomonas sp. CA1-15]